MQKKNNLTAKSNKFLTILLSVTGRIYVENSEVNNLSNKNNSNILNFKKIVRIRKQKNKYDCEKLLPTFTTALMVLKELLTKACFKS